MWRDRIAVLSKLANGIGLLPVFLLTCSVFSTYLLRQLMEASRITMFIAGMFALAGMLDLDEPKTDFPPKRDPSPEEPPDEDAMWVVVEKVRKDSQEPLAALFWGKYDRKK